MVSKVPRGFNAASTAVFAAFAASMLNFATRGMDFAHTFAARALFAAFAAAARRLDALDQRREGVYLRAALRGANFQCRTLCFAPWTFIQDATTISYCQ